jgi:hypothetical protein
MSATPPRWDLSNVYPGLRSPEFLAAMAQFERQVSEMEHLLDACLPGAGPDASVNSLAPVLTDVLTAFNELHTLSGTRGPYIHQS